MQDLTLQCIGCPNTFLFPVHEQQFFEKNSFSAPKRCRNCRAKRRREKEDEELKKNPTTVTGENNWNVKCMVEGNTPTIGETGLCASCCLGENVPVADPR